MCKFVNDNLVVMFNIEDYFVIYNEIAEKFHTIVKINVYKKYNWAQVAYMTDMFGGVYAIFHIDLNTGVTIYDYHGNDELKIDNFEMFEMIVKEKMNKMLESRDLDYIYDMINSEY